MTEYVTININICRLCIQWLLHCCWIAIDLLTCLQQNRHRYNARVHATSTHEVRAYVDYMCLLALLNCTNACLHDRCTMQKDIQLLTNGCKYPVINHGTVAKWQTTLLSKGVSWCMHVLMIVMEMHMCPSYAEACIDNPNHSSKIVYNITRKQLFEWVLKTTLVTIKHFQEKQIVRVVNKLLAQWTEEAIRITIKPQFKLNSHKCILYKHW